MGAPNADALGPVDDVIVFDIGNVLVRWDPENLYRRLIPDADARARFLREVCTMAWHARHDAGVSFADNRAALIAEHPADADLIAAWDAQWDAMFGGVIEEAAALAQAFVDAGVRVWALSNLSDEKTDHIISVLPVLARFEGLVISGAERVIKPDPVIYRRTMERTGAAPHAHVFIDDRPENVAAAQSLGWRGVVFEDPKRLAADLAALDLADASRVALRSVGA